MQHERTAVLKSPLPVRNSTGEWRIPVALILLTLVPVVAGMVRLASLDSGTEVTPGNARFLAMPLPVIIHIVSASVFCVLGAFQFMTSIRRPGWHRVAGRVVAVSGIAAASSGLWMTQFYPLPPLHLQMEFLHVFRLLIGSAMLASIVLSVRAILNRDVRSHRAWMMRGYAIGQGVGTQAVLGLLWVLLFGQPDELNREVQLIAGWVVNLAVAEWIIRRQRPALPVNVAVAPTA